MEKHLKLAGRFADFWTTICRGKKVIGRVSSLARLARTGFVDEVILAAPHDREATLRVLQEARRLRLDVKLVPDLFGFSRRSEVERIGDLPAICLHQEPSQAVGLFVKRILDTVGAVLVILPAPADCGADSRQLIRQDRRFMRRSAPGAKADFSAVTSSGRW